MDGQHIQAAIYARVSSEQQALQHTIDSQVEALEQRVRDDGLDLEPELRFIDDAFSGSTLVRPALERLRDVAYAGGVDRVYVHSPDRLARKYAYQVLLVDEMKHHGVEFVFLNHALGQSPEEDLLLQVQGMISEYERAKIIERSRRGRRHAARRGSVNVLTRAPYGYRYVTKHEGGGEAHFRIMPTTANPSAVPRRKADSGRMPITAVMAAMHIALPESESVPTSRFEQICSRPPSGRTSVIC